MAATAELLIRILADTKQAQTDLDGTSSRVGKMQAGLSKMVAPAAVAVGAIVAVGAASVKSASSLQQSLGAVDAVFGESAGQIKKWAAGAAESAGLATSEYQDLAAVMGAQLKNMGVPMGKVAGQTDTLIRMGADLAATYGGTTKQAVEALGSAMRGETDPIERYGVSVKQADVAARQAADGTDKLTGEAAKQAKTAALLALITEQSADAQGQFARESDSAAGASQIAAAQFENTKAALGEALLPAVTAVTGALADLAGWAGKHPALFQAIVGVILALASAILVANVAMNVITITTKAYRAVAAATWLVALGPIGLVIAAIAAVVAIIAILWNKSETFRSIVLAVWGAVKAGALAMGHAIREMWSNVTGAIKDAAQNAGTIVRAVWGAIREAWNNTTGAIREMWSNVTGAIREAAGSVREHIVGAFRTVRDVVVPIFQAVKEAWATQVTAMKAAMNGLAAVLRAPFDAVKSAIDAAADAVQSLIGWLGRIKVPSINLPNLPGGRAVTPAGVATPAVARTGGLAPRAAASSGGGVSIVVNGAIDPEATARQIRRLLAGHDRRVGLVT